MEYNNIFINILYEDAFVKSGGILIIFVLGETFEMLSCSRSICLVSEEL